MTELAYGPWREVVNGVVVGGAPTWLYEFWTTDGKRKIDHGYFGNDAEALTAFMKAHPDEYATGAEMRCYDQRKES